MNLGVDGDGKFWVKVVTLPNDGTLRKPIQAAAVPQTAKPAACRSHAKVFAPVATQQKDRRTVDDRLPTVEGQYRREGAFNACRANVNTAERTALLMRQLAERGSCAASCRANRTGLVVPRLAEPSRERNDGWCPVGQPHDGSSCILEGQRRCREMVWGASLAAQARLP